MALRRHFLRRILTNAVRSSAEARCARPPLLFEPLASLALSAEPRRPAAVQSLGLRRHLSVSTAASSPAAAPSPSPPLEWLPVIEDDEDMQGCGVVDAAVEHITRLSQLLHPSAVERREVVAERVRLFPRGCSLLVRTTTTAGGSAEEEEKVEVIGYALSHPWKQWQSTRLDALLGSLPEDADTYYLHDIAMLPEARGQEVVVPLMQEWRLTALSLGLTTMSGVAIAGTVPYWETYGFRTVDDKDPRVLAMKLQDSYGEGARYMTKTLTDNCLLVK